MSDGIFHTRGDDFHLEEYKALRAEVLALLETLRSLERNVIVAVGVSWAWLIDKGDKTPKWSWFVPVLFAVLGMWRVRGILRFFGQFRAYLFKLEDAYFVVNSPEGWQHFTQRWGKAPNGEKASGEKKLSDGTVAFWATLFLVTLAVAIWEVSPYHFR